MLKGNGLGCLNRRGNDLNYASYNKKSAQGKLFLDEKCKCCKWEVAPSYKTSEARLAFITHPSSCNVFFTQTGRFVAHITSVS